MHILESVKYPIFPKICNHHTKQPFHTIHLFQKTEFLCLIKKLAYIIANL